MSEFGTLGDRTSGRRPAERPTRARHVQVLDDTGAPHPGLLLGWSRHPDGWWGRVVWAPAGDPLLEEFHARRLRPS